MDNDLDMSALRTRSARVAPDSTVDIGRLRVPFSAFATPQARATFLTGLKPVPPGIENDVTALRQHYAAFNDVLRDQMLERFSVEIVRTEIAGVPVDRVTSKSGDNDKGRVLINLHGGAFMWGSGSGALVEAIPVAASSGLPVIAVDYRLAPEHTFPAAADDVQAVYEALLNDVSADTIGIYGCSAGAILAAQCMAQFLQRRLPLPGGIAMLCGAGLLPFGDSSFTASALCGERPDGDGSGDDIAMLQLQTYLKDIALDDPRVAPGLSPEILSKFPPPLLISGSRDFTASSVTTMHRRLVAQHVYAEMFLFDGLWHAFHVVPDLPESNEVYGLLADFFDRTLGGKGAVRPP